MILSLLVQVKVKYLYPLYSHEFHCLAEREVCRRKYDDSLLRIWQV